MKLVANGEIVTDIYRLVLEQIRSKRETAGDLRAQIACNNTGVRRLTGLVDQTRRRGVRGLSSTNCSRTRLGARWPRSPACLAARSRRRPVDTDGFSDEPVHLQDAVTVDDDGVLFDLTGCDPQRRAPVNSTYAQTYSNCAYVLKSLIDPDIPVNDGLLPARPGLRPGRAPS